LRRRCPDSCRPSLDSPRLHLDSPLPAAAAGHHQQGKLTLGFPLPLPDRTEALHIPPWHPSSTPPRWPPA
jgi:hypothetical protein